MGRWSRFRRLFGPEPTPDVEAELMFHVEMRERELIDAGVPPERARALALRRFGDYNASRSECVAISERRRRRLARTEYMTELSQDVAYALRTLRRAPGFAAVALLTLALGIGANSAIFSVVYGVLLAPLPFPEADRLYRITTLYPDGSSYSVSPPDFMSLREQSRAYDRMEAFSEGLFTVRGAGEPMEIRGTRVSDGLLDILGFQVVAGRSFRPEEHRPGRASVALLDHGFWQRQFGANPSALGRTLSVGGDNVEIIGVLAPGAQALAAADVYMPLEYDETFSASTSNGRRGESLRVIGRAKPDTAGSLVDEDARRIGTQLQQAFPDTNDRLTFTARPLSDVLLGNVRRPLLILLGAVGFVLLVACANVANLMLARASARQSELAVRAALGASRGRLSRQLLTEALVLGLGGGCAALLLAHVATEALVAAQPADIPRLRELSVNRVVVSFTFVLAVATSLLFGALPALQFNGRRLPGALHESTRGGSRASGQRVRTALVVAEMSLAVILLVGAGLLIRSFVRLMQVDPGFRPDHALSFRVPLQGDRYAETPMIVTRVAEIEHRLASLPGVTRVGVTSVLPLSGRGSMIGFAVEGRQPPPNVNAEIAQTTITPGYFAAIGAPAPVRGRAFTSRDTAAGPAVALLNEAAARLWFPDRDPIGARVITNGTPREVVGILADVLQRSAATPTTATVFVPFAQRPSRSVKVVVRTASDPMPLVGAIRGQIRALDPELAVAAITPLTQLVHDSVASPRFYTGVLSLFAAVALVLAATGVFGVMSYTVSQRSREISIRMALGALPHDVLRMILGRALALSAIGVVLGIVGALVLGRFLERQLFEVTPLDPLTLATVASVLSASAALASYLPARRATRLDPADTLRDG